MNILWVALIIIVVISYIFFQKETKKINTIFKKLAEEKSNLFSYVLDGNAYSKLKKI